MLVALLIGCILAIWPAQGRISVAHLGKTVRQQRGRYDRLHLGPPSIIL